MIRTNLYIWNVFLAPTRCQDVCLCGLSQLSLICICLAALFSSLTVGAWNTASVVYRMWADDPLRLRSSSQRHPSHYVNYVLNEQFQYESVPNHKWMYRKMINPHFSMRVALGVRIMSSLWNRIDSLLRQRQTIGYTAYIIYLSSTSVDILSWDHYQYIHKFAFLSFN